MIFFSKNGPLHGLAEVHSPLGSPVLDELVAAAAGSSFQNKRTLSTAAAPRDGMTANGFGFLEFKPPFLQFAKGFPDLLDQVFLY